MVFRLYSFVLIFLVVSCGEDIGGGNKHSDSGTTRGEDSKPGTGIEAELELSKYLPSQNLRARGSELFSHDKIRELVRDGLTESTTHFTPNLETDLESSIIHALPPENDCGLDPSMTITEKRNDCKNLNSLSYKWAGKTSGIYAEGNWLLVMKEGETLLWVDTNTGLLWSAVVGNATYLRAAIGNDENEAACVANSSTKALGYLNSNNVKWRLPSRNDYLLADLNGARFVLSQDENTFWTASPIDGTTAWAIQQSSGILSKKNQTEAFSIRCVGIDLR